MWSSSSQVGLVDFFVRLSSCSLLASQTVTSLTLLISIIFVPLCAIRLTPSSLTEGSHIGLQNVTSHGYLSERYENHGIPDCCDNHEKMPAQVQTQPISTAVSIEGFRMQSKKKTKTKIKTNKQKKPTGICMCRWCERRLLESWLALCLGTPPLCWVEKWQC